MTEVAGDPIFIRVNGFNDTWASGFTPIFLSDGISLPTSALVYIPHKYYMPGLINTLP